MAGEELELQQKTEHLWERPFGYSWGAHMHQVCKTDAYLKQGEGVC